MDFQFLLEKYFKEITEYYSGEPGGFSVFYKHFMKDEIPDDIKFVLLNLLKKLKNTIIKNPMRYIGNSYYHKEYSIYTHNKNSKPLKVITRKNLIENLGTFNIPLKFYEAFYLLGSLVTGKDSLILKWADFTVNLYHDKEISHQHILDLLLKSPTDERNVVDIRKLLSKYKSEFKCTWSNTNLNDFVIDHMIPFSVYRNNDLWNLVPVNPKINNRKSNKIPSKELLLKRKDLIIHAWEVVSSNFENRFFYEMQIDLIGNQKINKDNWQLLAFANLIQRSEYLINIRGCEIWNI